MKLTIELVPKTSWYDNMRKVLSKAAWDKIRRETYKKYGNRCGICKAAGRLSCHEIWQYDDREHQQTLLGFIALCDLCHHVKHIGFAWVLAEQGKLDYKKVISHFIKVNRCSNKEFVDHKKAAFELWRKRSMYKWEVNLGKYRK